MLLVVGLGFLVLAVVGFGMAIVGRPGQLGLHAMSTMPAILGVAALTGAWSLLRTPSRVTVGSDGLTIESKRGIQLVRWDNVGCAGLRDGRLEQSSAIEHHRSEWQVDRQAGPELRSVGRSGRDDLGAVRSERRWYSRTDTPCQGQAPGCLAFLVGLFLAFACGFVGWTTYQNQRAMHLLEEQGEPGDG